MKKLIRWFLLGVLSCALLALAVLPAMAETPKPTDVPPNHWAYKAVVTLVEKGYLTYFEDGTFRGKEPVDRFNMAVIVAKILNEIALGNKTASKEDMAMLRKLTVEFQDELVALSAKVNLFNERLVYLENGYKLVQDDSARAENDIQDLQKQAEQMVADILVLKKQMEELEGREKIAEQDLGALRDRVSKLEERVADNEKEIHKLKSWNVITTVLAVIGILV